MRHRQLKFIWGLVCLVIVAVPVGAQTKPAAKSITVYKTPT